ncbi:hypothetical protein LOK49_Contig116G00007 [Camellia lanceoleosa]|nr:hypothetical protein LOK49_Contig116G00007 [Camellia lanceoleosa]
MSIDINHGLQRRTIKIGSALKKLFEDSVVQRKDLWITSKLWCTDHAPEYVEEALEQILRNKFFGVKLGSSNRVRNNQFFLELFWDQQPQLHAFCKSKGLHLSGYSPLGSPGYQKSDILKNPILNMVAEKLSKSPAQVALCWALEMGHNVIPKGTNETRLKENFDVFDWSIPEDLFAKFSEIEQANWFTLKKLFEDGGATRKTCGSSGYSPLGSPGYQKSDILKNPILNMVAEKLSKSPAQVALCWALEMGPGVLPKGTNETRLKENFDVFDWSIPEDLFAKFSEIEQARSHFSSHTTLKSSV